MADGTADDARAITGGEALATRPAIRHTHVLGLDLLRLFASSLVVFYHFGFWNWTRGQPLALALPGKAPPGGAHLHFGWVGVEIFFVISGFVIAYTAADARPGAFLRARFLRLAPVNWIAATIALLILLATGLRPWRTVVIGYIQTLVFWPLDAIDGVWWTLGIEIDFYLLTYLLIRQGRAHLLEKVLVPIGIASGLFWIAALTLQSVLAGREGALGLLHMLVLRAEGNRELQLLLVQHGCFFALGVVLWKASASGMTRWRAGATALLVAACLLEIVGQNGIISRVAQMDLSPLPAILVWFAAMGLFRLSLACNAALARRLGAAAGLIRFIGLLTYPLYLLHDAIGIGVTLALAPRLGALAVAVGIASGFALAAIVAGWAEPSLRGWIRKRLPL